uniref:Uncharacterized protein n=1 Tax=Arundo donax TaxID=35708 RepID=A0A0A9FHT5_ARUDO
MGPSCLTAACNFYFRQFDASFSKGSRFGSLEPWIALDFGRAEMC